MATTPGRLPRCFRLSPETVEGLMRAAERREISEAALVREILREWLAQHG